MKTELQKNRPKFLNLFKIKQPLPAQISILHRISGVLLFFPGIPLLLYGLHLSLASPESFAGLQAMMNNPLVKCALLLPVWLFMHHLCAGIRHLALDVHLGVSLEHARFSSKLVLFMGGFLTILVGIWLW